MTRFDINLTPGKDNYRLKLKLKSRVLTALSFAGIFTDALNNLVSHGSNRPPVDETKSKTIRNAAVPNWSSSIGRACFVLSTGAQVFGMTFMKVFFGRSVSRSIALRILRKGKLHRDEGCNWQLTILLNSD